MKKVLNQNGEVANLEYTRAMELLEFLDIKPLTITDDGVVLDDDALELLETAIRLGI